MTRCMRNEVNLKSTAYNQTGQNYFEQLAAYNSMSQHLRRILLAKSVIDTRNKNYMYRKNKRGKPAGEKRICSLPEVTDDIIDRLAYDTQHHPMTVLRMKPNSEYMSCCDYNLEYRRPRNCGRPCCIVGSKTARRQRSTSRGQRSASPATTSKRKKFIPNTVYGMEFKIAQKNPCMIGSSISLSRQRKCRYETDFVFVPCTTLGSSECKPTCCSPTQETNDYRLSSSRTLRTPDDSDHDDKVVARSASQQDDEKKYVNFIYDITKEIKQSGLYTDKELQDVFKKHIDKNKGILDMNMMLYEIYQLKISLNMLDDGSDIDDELEELIHAQSLLHISEVRPPMLLKMTNENKVIEKPQSYKKLMKAQDGQSNNVPTKKPPDFNYPKVSSITLKDVMMGIVETQIRDQMQTNPQPFDLLMSNQVVTQDVIVEEERIDGQEASDVDKVPSESESEAKTSYSSQFEESEGSGNDDKRLSLTGETIESSHASAKDRSIDSSAKKDANSSTSNLVSMQDETIETEKKIDGQEESDIHIEES